ncbi:MAG: hypothetical protein ACPKPY_00250, partial [Nitrososphaeraceae archaeon]
MSKTKIGIFSTLLLGVMMLLIPAISISNAQEYEDRYGKVSYVDYEDNKYYYEDDEYVYEEYYYPLKDKKNEHPMLLINKTVLYCDSYSSDNKPCFPVPGPNSERYVEECTDTGGSGAEVCNKINVTSFNMIVTDNIEFSGSEEGTKLSLNGERYTVTESVNVGEMFQNESQNSQCQEAGFDSGFMIGLSNTAVS